LRVKGSRGWLWRLAVLLSKTVGCLYLFWCGSLLVLRFIDPPFTGVHVQRRMESWFKPGTYAKRYEPVPLARISRHLQHAVVAAEDGNFHDHWGLDLGAMAEVAREGAKRGRVRRGASTITQQLIKNIFFTTHRNPVRKVVEWTLAPVAEILLGKQRILELYLNIIEWGPGVYGAEAAARYHYRASAASLGREQAARLAACIPAPRRRRPAMMNGYAGIIERRMGQHGW
jgi:monofunctional glycosyltransferase